MNDELNAPGRTHQDGERAMSGLVGRRLVLATAVGSFVAGTNGLHLPGWLQATEAREGALEGSRGGRRGKNRRGRHGHRRQRNKNDRDRDKQKDDDAPRGGCLNVLDMTLIFKDLSGTDQLMSVADGGGGCNFAMTYRWKNKVVPKFQEYQFVGWYPDMLLNLFSVSPNLHFEARNPGVGFPSMKVTKDDPTAPGGRKTILDQGFFVDEAVSIEGFEIKRQEDFDEHKVFVIAKKL